MKRFAVALLVASFIGVTTVACDNTAEPNAVSVHVCDPCVFTRTSQTRRVSGSNPR